MRDDLLLSAWADMSVKSSGAAMTYPLDARVRTRHATEAVRQTGPQAREGLLEQEKSD